jgi:epoxyqueuosine reductase
VLRDQLQALATDRGCVGFGVTTAEPFDGVAETMASRRAGGFAADLSFTYRDPAVAADVRRSFPWAHRLVSVAYAYEPEAGRSVSSPGSARIARFADGDHYLGLRVALASISESLESSGARAVALSDDSRLVDRAAAVRAGIGWWGRSTMVLVPGTGPWVLLGSVVTDAPLDVDDAMARSCGTCTACIPACPTGAILDGGVLDVRRCLSYHLQRPGMIPVEMRAAVGDRLYGCDDCLTSCPPGNRAIEAAAPATGPGIVEILRATDHELLERYGHFYLPSRRPRILRRNALVAAGNDRSPSLEPVVIGHLGHPDWLLRAHAAWAVGEFSSPIGAAALRQALASEPDGRVRVELKRATAAGAPSGGLR